MGILLLVIHIAVCAVLIMVVLLQSGKAADLAGAFGGGGSQTALGSRGAATFLTKATTTSAVLFMLTSMGLAILGSRHSGSVLESVPVEAVAPAAAAAGTAGDPGAGTAKAPGGAPTDAAPAGTGEKPASGTGDSSAPEKDKPAGK